METKFNFKSQICTDKNQSERLLALGLKKETADMHLQSTLNDVWSPYIPIAMPYSKVEAFNLNKDVFRIIPAWSLGRLVEDLMPQTVTYRLNDYHLSLNLREGMIGYFPPRLSARIRALEYFYGNDTILDDCISCIEWLIKEGYFNKEYLK
ncbi:MAG: hypothetical protein IKV75_05730 [Bacteroidales bacterium]|nr:hypothetical protein [Bacteroidales bacterium]